MPIEENSAGLIIFKKKIESECLLLYELAYVSSEQECNVHTTLDKGPITKAPRSISEIPLAPGFFLKPLADRARASTVVVSNKVHYEYSFNKVLK